MGDQIQVTGTITKATTESLLFLEGVDYGISWNDIIGVTILPKAAPVAAVAPEPKGLIYNDRPVPDDALLRSYPQIRDLEERIKEYISKPGVMNITLLNGYQLSGLQTDATYLVPVSTFIPNDKAAGDLSRLFSPGETIAVQINIENNLKLDNNTIHWENDGKKYVVPLQLILSVSK